MIPGAGVSDLDLLKIFLNNLEKSITDFSLKFGIKSSFLGGNTSINLVLQKLKKGLLLHKNINFINGDIFKIYKEKNRFSGILLYSSEKFNFISSKILVIASGGFSNIFEFNDNIDNNYLSNIIGVSIEAGLDMRNLEFLMFHPFGEDFSGTENIFGKIVKTDFLAGKKVENYKGERVKDLEYILNSHNAHQNFPKILKIFNQNKNLQIGEKLYKPIVHYTIGGINQNKSLETNISGIFVLGESAIGVSGASRIGGISLSEIIVFSGVLAGKIEKYLCENDFLKNRNLKINFNININKILETKKQIQNTLNYELLYGGNHYDYEIAFKKIEKLYDCTYKTLALALLKSMIFRKESRGSFYRQDYSRESLFTYNTFLHFENGKFMLKRRYVNNFFRLKYFLNLFLLSL